MKDLVVYGTGGLGRQVVQLVSDINADHEIWRVLGYLDDAPEKAGTLIAGLPVHGSAAWLLSFPDVHVALAIGNPVSRRRTQLRLEALSHKRWATVVHPSAIVGSRCRIGDGTLICAGTVIDPDVHLGDFTLVNSLCCVSHDCRIGEFATLAPGVRLAGRVQVGQGCELGIGSMAIQSLSIGEWSIIGAGAVLIDDLDPNVTAVGVPAKIIKRRSPGWHLDV